MADDYEVGYGKPPKRMQFEPGRSGNPKGRPKGSQNLSTLIRKTLDTKITVKGPDGISSMSMLEAGITQLVTKAAKGDFKAIKEVIRLSKEVQEQNVHLNAPRFVVSFVKPPDEEKARGEKNGSNGKTEMRKQTDTYHRALDSCESLGD